MTVPVHGLPPLLKPGMTVALVPPALKADRWHEVRSVDEGPSGQLVALTGVTNIASADELVGCTVLAAVDSLPEDYLVHDADALLGREVNDLAHGALGTIVEVMQGAAQDVWVIQGPYGEVLVPVVEEFVLRVDASGPIEVRVPDGTISLKGSDVNHAI